MLQKYHTYKYLLFADNERPTSFKINQILDMLESTRLANGPYSISLYSQRSTSFDIQLHEDITDVGGVYLDGFVWRTYRCFTVYYETRESISSYYGCWRDVRFSNYSGIWRATLLSGSNLYNNQLDVSDIDTNALYCVSNIDSGWAGR